MVTGKLRSHAEINHPKKIKQKEYSQKTNIKNPQNKHNECLYTVNVHFIFQV